MKTMNGIPKDRLILLLLPSFDIFSSGWWIGRWSYTVNMWSLKTPYSFNGKMVITYEIPQPIGWAELPSPIEKN